MLTKEQIFQIQDSRIEKLTIPEWGGEVFVRSMTSKERDQWELRYSKDKSNLRASFAVQSVCNEAGELLFTEKDIEPLGLKSASALAKIFNAVTVLNGYVKSDVDELEGN